METAAVLELQSKFRIALQWDQGLPDCFGADGLKRCIKHRWVQCTKEIRNTCKQRVYMVLPKPVFYPGTQQEYGNPKGQPAIFLHGGPGAGCTSRHA